MSLTLINCCRAVLLAGMLGLAQTMSASDDTLASAKQLYESAAYEEALVVLDRLQGKASAAEATSIAEYRVFCLLALERNAEARKTIEGILHDNPLYQLSGDQASPRIQSIFRDVRRQSLPQIVVERYAAAKVAFEQKDPKAEQQFDSILVLLDDPDVQAVATLKDLRTVVAAFRDLTKAVAVESRKPVAQVPAVAPVASGADSSARSTPAVTTRSSPDTIFSAADLDVIPPMVQSQNMPAWTPTLAEVGRDFRGAVELLIDEKGTVLSAAIRTSVNPAYDARLLKAARSWKYTPARRRGIPVRYSKVVAIRLTSTPS